MSQNFRSLRSRSSFLVKIQNFSALNHKFRSKQRGITNCRREKMKEKVGKKGKKRKKEKERRKEEKKKKKKEGRESEN